MYDVKSLKAEEFISDEEIRETLAYADANKDNVQMVDEILKSSASKSVICLSWLLGKQATKNAWQNDVRSHR